MSTWDLDTINNKIKSLRELANSPYISEKKKKEIIETVTKIESRMSKLFSKKRTAESTIKELQREAEHMSVNIDNLHKTKIILKDTERILLKKISNIVEDAKYE